MKNLHLFEEFNQLSERSVKREIEHVTKDEFSILTAWRSGLSHSVNSEHMHELKADLKSAGLGFVGMTGIGQELGGKHSSEPSMLVINHHNRKDFHDLMMSLARKYEQDYIVYGKDGVSHLVATASGENEKDFTHVFPGKAEYYSALAGAGSTDIHAFHLDI